MTFQDTLNQLVGGNHLSRDTMRDVMMTVMTGSATDAQIGALLEALRM